jgi:hypothetical protein
MSGDNALGTMSVAIALGTMSGDIALGTMSASITPGILSAIIPPKKIFLFFFPPTPRHKPCIPTSKKNFHFPQKKLPQNLHS